MDKKAFFKLWQPWLKLGFYFATSPSGVCKYVISPEGKKVVIAFSNEERVVEFLKFSR